MKETRKQKIARQQRHATERAAERVIGPIRYAIEAGDLVITPLSPEDRSVLSGLEFCARCGSGPRQRADVTECPDCGNQWAGPRLLP
jgi:hypothetical protein